MNRHFRPSSHEIYTAYHAPNTALCIVVLVWEIILCMDVCNASERLADDQFFCSFIQSDRFLIVKHIFFKLVVLEWTTEINIVDKTDINKADISKFALIIEENKKN